MRQVLPAVAVVFLAILGRAQGAPVPLVKPSAKIDWKASGSLPPGAEYHLIYEDPKTHAVQTLVRFPKGYGLPAHTHSADETIVVVKGKLVIEVAGQSEILTVGGYAVIPAGTSFTLKAAGFGGADFLAAFNGPFDMKGPAASK